MKRTLTQEHIGCLLTRAYRQFTNRWLTELKPVGLTVDMWIVLGMLHEKPGQSMTSLAEDLSLNLPTVTKLIDRMVSDNMVYRKPHHRDRRRVLIFPTERGLELYHEATALAQKLEQRILSEVDADGTLRRGLSRLIASEN